MRGVRPWNVMHATERVRDVLEVAEAQRAIGMRPVLVTPAGYGSIELYLRAPVEEERAVSLLGTWQEVRRWRKSMADCGSTASTEIVHAHSFSAGMAGVRNWPAVVYDLRACVEDDADAGQAWLARSLRVAEQFVLARAEAVVLHWPSLKAAAVERGAGEEHVFIVPDVVAEKAPDGNGDWRERMQIREDAVTFFAADVHVEELDVLLSAFAQVVSEVVSTVLLLEAADPASALLRSKLAAAGISRAVRLVPQAQRDEVIAGCDVVLTGTSAGVGPNPAGLKAMTAGRALLAEDVTANRDLSPAGRGCLWYKAGDARDLVGRASFLARNPEFRRSLGDSARAYIAETRAPEAVARQYEAVYLHAHARRRNGSQPFFGNLQPIQAAF
ncbi:MAG TPA: glycosyltransferase family 4 protein [Terriglobales bacterium]|nr:glycosyltransferase family 4 protein [Terriglobales bacterium]